MEWLWKTAHTFTDLACSYEDFKAEIIALYPEAIAAQEHTLVDLDRVVSDCARTQIGSEAELREFYHEFLTISRSLISKGRISMQMQSHQFLASFEPRLGTAICARLHVKFPDQFPDDPYNTDAIFNAALYVLAWQRTAPLVQPSCPVPPPVKPTLTSPDVSQLPPQAIYAFPLVSESHSLTCSDTISIRRMPVQECYAPLVPIPRNLSKIPTQTVVTPAPILTPPPPVRTL